VLWLFVLEPLLRESACSRKSYEQAEELLAARFPKPDVRDLIRRLPAPAPHVGSQTIETLPIEIEAGARLTEATVAQSTQRLIEGPGLPAGESWRERRVAR
jgi:hypothetical protein